MFYRTILLVLLAVFVISFAEDDDSDYTVWVDKLNVRESAGVNAKIVTMLKMGDELTVDWIESWVEKDGYLWVKVSCNDTVGWVAHRYILPLEIYKELQPADELGKAGKTAEMIDELNRIRQQPGLSYEKSLLVSPDGQKTMLYLQFPGDTSERDGCTVYFCSQEGLVDVLYLAWWNEHTKWSEDSRFCFCPGVYCSSVLYDTMEHKTMHISIYRNEFDFAGKYLIWLTLDTPKDYGEYRFVYLPSLEMCELKTGKISRILVPDIKTLRKAKPEDEVPEVKLIQRDAVPSEVTSSSFYRKYADKYTETGMTEG